MEEPGGLVLIDKGEVVERECQSCEKRYPENYLTLIKESIRRA